MNKDLLRRMLDEAVFCDEVGMAITAKVITEAIKEIERGNDRRQDEARKGSEGALSGGTGAES